jgi:hypothetical protein
VETMPQVQRPQKVKLFASANVAGLERDMNTWLRSGSSSPPVVRQVQVSGWGSGGETGDYTVMALVLYE